MTLSFDRPAFEDAVRRLMTHVPDVNLKAHSKVNGHSKQYPMFEPGDETAPFLTEAHLYNMYGKDEARTIHALIRNLIRAAGYQDEWAIPQEAPWAGH